MVQTTTTFGEQILVDTLTFEIGWIVEIISVESGTLLNERYWIPRTNFTKKTDVNFKITVKNIDLTPKTFLLTLVCYDQDVVPLFQAPAKNLTIPEKTTEEVYVQPLMIPKWAAEGEAKAYANAFTDYPLNGGIAYCPEVVADFNILNTIDDTAPPLIYDASREPEIVQLNQEVTISVNVTDLDCGVQEVVLFYHVNTGTSWIGVKMNQTTANTFKGSIPGFPAATRVNYVIIAYDYAGNFAIDENAGQYYVCMIVSEYLSWTLVLSALGVSAFAAIICKRKAHKKK